MYMAKFSTITLKIKLSYYVNLTETVIKVPLGILLICLKNDKLNQKTAFCCNNVMTKTFLTFSNVLECKC